VTHTLELEVLMADPNSELIANLILGSAHKFIFRFVTSPHVAPNNSRTPVEYKTLGKVLSQDTLESLGFPCLAPHFNSKNNQNHLVWNSIMA
jgi:hypothetical protein